MPFTAEQIARELRAEVLGDGSVELTGIAPADRAGSGDLTFAENEAYFAAAEQSQASAILAGGSFTSPKKTIIRVPNPRIAVARILPLFFPPEPISPGVHPSAVVASSAHVPASAYVGPNCTIGERVRLGERCRLIGNNYVGNDCRLGDDTCLYPNVVVYAQSLLGDRVSIHAGTVIGSDGFGYVVDEGRQRKMLQPGNVVIHDDVEIGANSTVDRATLGSTVIGEGTKIDNLVQVGHNVVIGRHCIVTAQAGLAGSCSIGDYSVVASQVGVAGHLKIGKQVIVGAKSGVMRDVPDGEKVLGVPAYPDKQAKRQIIAVQQLPELIRRVRELEQQVAELRQGRS